MGYQATARAWRQIENGMMWVGSQPRERNVCVTMMCVCFSVLLFRRDRGGKGGEMGEEEKCRPLIANVRCDRLRW